ncbi:SDR family NAD(P)-dependent oxidoreductase [Thalassobaculum sp.]|uniref:type I polyketide synthase n=1 Tax=Thalassobaculum sp. TaxID=2022740 RepID=UPI0032F03156
MTGGGSKIAIVGMSGRFPGAPDVATFWRNLRAGVDAIADLGPDDRAAAGVSAAEWDDPRYVRTAAVLDGIDRFDPGFFGLNAEQAELLDPQHRLFFECAWEALEDAAVVPERFAGPVGVFAGCAISSYLLFNLLPGLKAGASPATLLAMIGNEKDYLASHLAYLLGLRGPSVGIQTACSTSLVAVHAACQSLLSGECDMALAGGASIRVPHRVGYRWEDGSILSPTGRCRSFDAAADGTVFGSGVGVVALRRLDDALRDGDPVHAVILGSAVNNDGAAKAGFTAPGVDGQAAVVAEALAVAGVGPSSVGYVEAHGTATPIGDPIEIRALAQAFPGVAPGAVALGSAKASVGHLEAAAGVTGLIAAALAVRDGVVPPVAHFREANPLLRIDETPFRPAGVARDWTAGGVRRAGVSSFGIGGTNAHVVLEQAPDAQPVAGSAGPVVLAVSARDEAALAEAVRRQVAALADDADMAAVSRTALLGRRAFAHRVAVVARTPAEARDRLAAASPAAAAGRPRLGLLFTGQGAWAPGTGRALAAAFPVVRAVLDEAEAMVPGVRATLFEDTADRVETARAQPALLALQWALTEQLRAWGVGAAASAGHSVGEIAAAAACGLIAWEDALRFAAERGRLMGALPAGGTMAAAMLEPAAAETLAAGSGVSVAAVNGPRSVVLSGEAGALDAAVAGLDADGVPARRLAVSHAFHSALMGPALADLATVAPSGSGGHATLVSTLTGGAVTSVDPQHWARHARGPVRFADALSALSALGCTSLLEIGPGTTLRDLARPQVSGVAVTSALGGGDEVVALLEAIAALHCQGVPVDWATALPTGPRTRLPTYPFQRRRYWRDPSARTAAGGTGLPGAEIETPLARRLFATTLTPTSPAWLGEHRVQGRVVLPAAAFAALALAAGAEALGATTVEAMLEVPEGGVAVQTAVAGDGTVTVHARTPDGWRRHAVAAPGASAVWNALDLAAIRARCGEVVDIDGFYTRMAADGIDLGPRFRLLSDIRAGDGEALATVAVPAPDGDGPIPVPLLDAMFQTLGAVLQRTDLPGHLPTGFDGLSFDRAALAAGGAFRCHARLRDRSAGAVVGDLSLVREDGAVALRVDGLVCRPAAAGQDVRRHLYRPVWVPADPRGLPKPSAVSAGIAVADDLTGYQGYGEAVDRLCGAYVACAFAGAGFAPVAQFDRLMPRLWRMLEEDGVVEPGQRILRRSAADPDALLADLKARYPGQAAETAMLARCGRALADLLAGHADPLAVLFGADDATGLYGESRYATALNGLAAAALERAVDGRAGLRVLEVGGGTGGTTRHLLPVLAGRLAEYRFTDVSAGFLAAAGRRFAGVDGFAADVLDIERDPAGQGATAGDVDIVVAANVLHATADLSAAVGHAAAALAPGGWLLLVEGLRPSRWLDLTFGLTEGWWRGTDRDLRPDYPLVDAAAWRRLLADAGFDDVAILTPGEGRLGEQAVILARKAPGTPATVCRAALGAENPAAAVLPAVQGADGRLLIATRGAQGLRPWDLPDPAQAAVLGLAKAAGLERPAAAIRLVDLDTLDLDPDATLAAEAVIDDGEIEVAWRDGRRFAQRLLRLEAPAPLPEIFRLVQHEPGRLDALAFEPSERAAPGPGEVEIRVLAAGLNFKDVLTAAGLVPGDGRFGGECAGEVSAVGPGVDGLRVGDRVLAVAGGSLASHVVVPAARAVPVPDGLTLEQAAAIPVAGFTAWHALVELAEVKPGDRVLVHAAAGGVGHFAVSLALKTGAEVLATAGSEWKRAHLRRLGVAHVLDSRSTDFAAGVMAATGGQGVDVVLNSLTGDAVRAGLSVLKPGGRFVEIGRTGVWPAERVAAEYPGVRYHVVALDAVTDDEGGRLLRAAVDAVADGRMDLPPLTVMPMAVAADGFRLMQRAGHLGKVVLSNPAPFRFRADRSYLVTGGLGGLGLAVADWAVAAGARHLVLASRRAPDAETSARIDRLRETGAEVRTVATDVSQAAGVEHLLAGSAADLPPLAAVFHAAGELDDGPLAEMTPARLRKVMAAKIDAAEHLDRLCGPLDAFVLFGSAAGLLGSPGQANHAAANTALDALAERRRARGLPALCVAWGPWREVGAADRLGVAGRLADAGMGTLSPAEGIAALAAALDAPWPRLAALPIDWPALRRHFGDRVPPVFRDLVEPVRAVSEPVVPAGPAAAADLRGELAGLPPPRRVERMAALVEAEARSLLAVGGAVRRDRPLNELGLDSLMAVELRNRLGALAGETLPATLLFNYPTVAAVAGYLVERLVGPAASPAVDDPIAGEDEEILSLSGDDLDSILREMEDRHLAS